MWYYQSTKDDSEVESKLKEIAEIMPMNGFWKYYDRIRADGKVWNHKRVRRVYCKMKMNIRRKHKHRVPTRVVEPLYQPEAPNIIWSMDFMHDTLESGRRFRLFNVIDDYNREALAVDVSTSFPGENVVRSLDRVKAERGTPEALRCDNGPENLSEAVVNWCKRNNVRIIYIQPGKPVQNSYIERFNGSLRKELLDAYIFTDLTQVRILAERWFDIYNNYRPHDSLNGESPIPYRLRRASALEGEASSPTRTEVNSNYEKSYF